VNVGPAGWTASPTVSTSSWSRRCYALRRLAPGQAVLVVDLYDPFQLEALELSRDATGSAHLGQDRRRPPQRAAAR
jgi:hypothetical protein